MLTANQIHRLLEQGAHARLIRRILGNGRSSDPAVADTLASGPAAAVTARALGLQRLLELRHGRGPDADRLAARLLEGLRAERVAARMSRRGASVPAATLAVATRALADWLAEPGPPVPTELRAAAAAEVTRTIDDLAIHHLHASGRPGGPRASGEREGRAAAAVPDHPSRRLTERIVRWQLGDVPAFRRAESACGRDGADEVVRAERTTPTRGGRVAA